MCELKENMLNKCWILFALILFFLVGAIQNNSNAEKFTLEQTIERSIVAALEDTATVSNNAHPNEKNIRQIIKTLSVKEGNLSVHLVTNNNLTNNTKNLILTKILADSTGIFREGFAHGLKSANILWDSLLTDPGGNVHNETVLIVTLTGVKNGDIDWSALPPENLPKVADHFWQHAFFGGHVPTIIGCTPY